MKKTNFSNPNPLELLREFTPISIANNIVEQITRERPIKNNEIKKGQTLNISEISSPKKQYETEKVLRQEEKLLSEKRTQELRNQLDLIQKEIKKIAKETPSLSQELRIAAEISINSKASTFEFFFLNHLLGTIEDFRTKIHEASTWLHFYNTRKAKKSNVWGQNYKKYGAKYLLSGEHYAQRSAA